ncbi:MAG: nucleoredoxin [Clostridiales bacterium]|jgi:nucleoredoxin|nr:nucleoredoxin [Clostridiales bacterium]MDN5283429.1 nucleoredoxin [Candidatus Ozemobacter sp.]
MMKKYLALILMIFVVSTAVFAQQTPTENPWKQNFPDGLIDAQQNHLSVDNLEGKIVGLYFSASWCRGCAAFSRTFVPFRNKHQKEFEVVMVGFDYSAPEMNDYMNKYKMEWPAIPYDSPARLAMKERFNVSEIPTLIIMAPNGQVLTKDGHQQVMDMEDGAVAHWQKLASEMETFESVHENIR